MNCLNCNAKLSCGCQKRAASDGKSVCSNCINSYEQKLRNAREKNTSNTNNKPPSS